jgi:UDP-N-acetylmuramyl tripeptide synthase
MTKEQESSNNTIVRVMGQGQYRVNEETVKKINDIDNAIVQILQNADKSDDQEFKAKITRLVQIITSEGQKLDDKEIVESDIIVPDSVISVNEAKKVFQGEGIIPDL